MSIVGLETIVYGVEDLDLGRRFFLDWGLEPEGEAARATVFRTLEGTSVVLCAKDDPTLPAAVEPGSTVREIAWGVESAAALDDHARRVANATEVTRGADGAVRFLDPAGMAIALVPARRRPLPEAVIAINTPEHRPRVDEPGTFYKKASPRRLGHAVLMVADIEKGERFYTEALGFRVSDRYRERGVFLRGRAEADHHQLFLLKSPDDRTHFHHLAFEVHDIHEVFGGGLAVSRRGWETHIGPGRHIISSCYFWYFKNPCGGAVEYFADADWLTDAWTPRDIVQGPEWFAEWALAQGIEQYGGVIR